MRRNCNLELQLLPSSSSSSSSHHRSTAARFSGWQQHPDINSNIANEEQLHRQQQQMTIFYNGRICVCDVTEIQAKAIIWTAATKEMEVRTKCTATTTPSPTSERQLNPLISPSTVRNNHQLISPTTSGLSMKRSLQHFLQSRRHRRFQAASPYHRLDQ